MTANGILWVYIVLLVIGGIMGWVKAKSRVSLIMSVAFAAVLCLCAAHVINVPHLVDILLVVLLVVFLIRLGKTKKFMPAGLMSLVTVITLALLHLAK
jgi:uncharacterized membrane protein (UPF0136 family)